MTNSADTHNQYYCTSFLIFAFFSVLYVSIAWVVSGGERWWVIDLLEGTNVFYGDDAYRFFLSRDAFRNHELYAYNFVLPLNLVLDGLITSLAQGNLFFSRSAHGVLSAFSFALLWSAGKKIELNRVFLLSAIVVIGLMPRYALTSLSFYGEFWFALMLSAAIWLAASKHWLGVSIVIGLTPLVRPEGIFFVLPVSVYFFLNHRWKYLLILVLPGFAYFIFLVAFYFPDLKDYYFWRVELRNVLNKISSPHNNRGLFDTYSVFFLAPALAGAIISRFFLPFTVGAVSWILYLSLLDYIGYANYEDRYTYGIVPLLAFYWAFFFSWANTRAIPFCVVRRRYIFVFCLFFPLMAFVSHLSSMVQISASVKGNGLMETARYAFNGDWQRIFYYHSEVAIQGRRAAAEKIHRMLADDQSIDRLVVYDPVLYYFLSPSEISDGVVVGYPATNYVAFHLLARGQVFVQHEKGYSYLIYGEPAFRGGERRALYVDLMPMKGYPYVWDIEGSPYKIYLLSYIESRDSMVPVDEIKEIDLDDIKSAYRNWFIRQ